MERNKRVENDKRTAFRRPNTAEQALPPSRRPIGKRFNAENTVPAKPTKNKGWIAIGCDKGIIIILGARTLVNDPTNKLVFIKAAGTVARDEICSADERMVKKIPTIIRAMEDIKDAMGPLIATSNIASLFLGNDLNGVMAPKEPICNDGRGTGNPIIVLVTLAAT
jgi:hypothetical protein